MLHLKKNLRCYFFSRWT